jgi:hypothetical protein
MAPAYNRPVVANEPDHHKIRSVIENKFDHHNIRPFMTIIKFGLSLKMDSISVEGGPVGIYIQYIILYRLFVNRQFLYNANKRNDKFL